MLLQQMDTDTPLNQNMKGLNPVNFIISRVLFKKWFLQCLAYA